MLQSHRMKVTGARLAAQQINAKGVSWGAPSSCWWRTLQTTWAPVLQKARKLIERDQVSFLTGDVNSGIAQAIAQVSNEKKVLHIVSGGHTGTITGSDCKWNVYRVCNTTSMEANAVASLLFSKYGKRWHFITPDYGFRPHPAEGSGGRLAEARRYHDRQ
ncbi:ABC transporter substrate-binding protein [Cupriavidus basilensis]